MAIPKTLPEATEQAKAATQAALSEGQTRLQVEMAIPELKQQPIAEQFLEIFSGQQFKVFFPDAGAAALARRDWGEPDFIIRGLGELATPIEPDDDSYLIVNPSSVEVEAVEDFCHKALDRPVILLNPKLEDIATIGIGYAGRQLRERFLNKIETCYYLRPIDQAAIYRCYPGPWQIWKETAPNEYELFESLNSRPSGEEIDRLLYGQSEAENAETGRKGGSGGRKRGLLGELQQFLRALSQ